MIEQLDLENHFHAAAYMHAARKIIADMPSELQAAQLYEMLTNTNARGVGTIVHLPDESEASVERVAQVIYADAMLTLRFLDDQYFTYMVTRHQTEGKLEPGMPDEFPLHDPDRFDTTDGFTSGMTNRERAELGCESVNLEAVADDGGFADEDFADLITNALHYAHSLGLDPVNIQGCGWRNFAAEAGPLPPKEDEIQPE